MSERLISVARFGALEGLLLLAFVAIVAGKPPTGHAAFPGFNGDIVFDSDRFGSEQIFRISGPGAEAIQLTEDGRNFSATWSPDGMRIAFVRELPFQPADIYVMNADGTQQTRLTTSLSQNTSASAPAWSADGSKIAFLRRNEAGNDIAIWTVDAGGGDPVLLIDSPGADTAPAFSPDGSKIAYGHNDPGENDVELYVANADGSNPMRLTDNTATDMWPNWSPDSSKIVYECRDPSGDIREICVVDADGANQHELPAVNPNNDQSPAWSPDGSRIVFESYPEPESIGTIYTMKLDGSDIQIVTQQGDYEPDWQPLSSPPLTQGDVDCDGAVTAVDALKELRFVAGLPVSQQPGCPHIGDNVASIWGDVDCGGDVNSVDALKVLRFVASLSVSQPDECPHIGSPEN